VLGHGWSAIVVVVFFFSLGGARVTKYLLEQFLRQVQNQASKNQNPRRGAHFFRR
jgi:UPF0716 family protein affecting phage T7 exclusion